jgi:hypothetical protein
MYACLQARERWQATMDRKDGALRCRTEATAHPMAWDDGSNPYTNDPYTTSGKPSTCGMGYQYHLSRPADRMRYELTWARKCTMR